jgi:hypothetical protein
MVTRHGGRFLRSTCGGADEFVEWALRIFG